MMSRIQQCITSTFAYCLLKRYLYRTIQSRQGDTLKAIQKKFSPAYYRCRNILPQLIVLLLIVTSCSPDVGKPNPAPSPTVTLTITSPAPRGLVAVDFEIDTPPNYTLGHTVALVVAQKIDQLATRVNSAGLVIFACRISSQSWQDCPVSFKTPAVPAWVLPSLDPTTHCPPDPFQCSKYKQQYKKALASWNGIHASQVKALGQIGTFVHTQTDKIRAMKFQFDDKGSDMYGALATCASNLQGIEAQYKFCVLATDFISTTQQQGSLSLAGIRVVSIFRTSSDNAFYQHSTSYWSHVFMSAGAISYSSYSVPLSQALGLELPE